MKANVISPAVAVASVTKSFKSVQALKGVSFEIERGEIVAILGPNGAGKTTLIDTIVGLTKPDSGNTSLFGFPAKQAVAKSLVGAVMQTGGMLSNVSVRDTVSEVAATFPQHIPVQQVLEETNLAGIAGRKVGKCSGGEMQRIRFALALLGAPDLLILDEPTAGMDPCARRDFWNSMEMQAERGRTIIFATHYLEEAEHFAKRVIFMNEGEVVADGTVDEVRGLVAGTKVESQVGDGLNLDQVLAWPEVLSAHMEGQKLSISTGLSDSVARRLLEAGATNLRISSASLEDSFFELTERNKK
ncbi:ABC transporter ATP-binding protein [Gleimia europaea]|uniref:ABC transporter domain-containing protein n=1 Tax=Gleimia europaea ACS-120-V-Col10b TaxID=883069 RepID=A0A9W5VVX4_9ACTO|nr:ABC transporter ATP-binding protein [Gleimia europaea]EPD30289.1 hypothetical protein HMPREF9238_00026 [Gleimia europaea ACS-120-V-Col10b]